ncbi:MAG: hypothetical protein V5A50_02055 [Thiohalorhabdus sp.]
MVDHFQDLIHLGLAHALDRGLRLALEVGGQGVDLIGGLRGLFGQLAHFIGDHGEVLAGLAGVDGLDGGV